MTSRPDDSEDGPKKPLLVWTICDGEPMPIDSNAPRLLRTAMLSQSLANRGHDVVYWTSRFDHLRKKDRLKHSARVDSGDGYMIHCTDRIAYSSNVSIKRLLHNAYVKRDAERSMRDDLRRPDVIVADLPTLELAEMAAALGKEWNVPVAISVRDLWPDVFYLLFPKRFRFLAPWFFARWNRRASNALKNASSIIGISKGYLDWGLAKAGRNRSNNDAIIPLGYPKPPPLDAEADEDAWQKLLVRGIVPDKRLICFVGTFGRSYDLATVIKAAHHLSGRTDVQFVFCGEGERGDEWRRLAVGLDNTLFLGWIEGPEIAALLRRASFGLAAYVDGAKQGLPNKFFEYMSFGVPILSSLGGEAKDEISSHGFGESYRPGDDADLAETLAALLGDEERLGRMATAARQHFADHYQQSKVCSEYAMLVENLANTSKRGDAAT